MDEAGENILDHFEYPRNYGALPNATFSQRADNPLCGDRVTLFVVISDQVVSEAHFEGRGCAISQAAASMLTEQLIGQSLDMAQALDVETRASVPACAHAPIQAVYGPSETTMSTQSAPPLIASATCGL